MSRILCVAVVLSVLSGPALAGMNEGVAAVTVGDYPKAISEFQPLAAAGDAAAQYQLAKIYLEGHGPADGVPQGIDLMTKAANGNYPEAQAQLGLMYAMGLGVQVDNAKAYEWLNKAVTALPEGTRRTVAEANRDAVLKRMNGGQGTNVAAAAPAPAVTPAPAPAATTATATKTPAASTAKATTETATSKPATTDAAKASMPAVPPAPAKVTETAKVETKPADAPAKPAVTATTTVANTSTGTPAKTPDTSTANTSTQVASAKAPETDEAAAPASTGSSSQAAAPSGVRIQLASLPSEELAWKAWKDLNGKYSSQLTGLTAIVQPADLGAKGTFYRVQTGPFDTLAAAQERCSAMKEAGLDCLVVGKP
ncbi:MAG TPA: SPOR domain-containing protein [Dongiaceae bacterium]